MEVPTFDVVVCGLIRDGADTWLCDLEIPTLGWKASGVYLFGKTEEEAYEYVRTNFRIVIKELAADTN